VTAADTRPCLLALLRGEARVQGARDEAGLAVTAADSTADTRRQLLAGVCVCCVCECVCVCVCVCVCARACVLSGSFFFVSERARAYMWQ
jgi:hypothetical protein